MEVAGEETPGLCDADRAALLRYARRTLENYLNGRPIPSHPAESRELKRPCACFVTLRRYDTGDLRGCRGEYVARRSLADSVAEMAIAAATTDSRFPPVDLEELRELRIEISALSPLRPIDPDEIEVGRHGLLIVAGEAAGLLLPKVPLAYGWERGDFLRALCQKASLPDDAWKSDSVELFGFEAEEWGEED